MVACKIKLSTLFRTLSIRLWLKQFILRFSNKLHTSPSVIVYSAQKKESFAQSAKIRIYVLLNRATETIKAKCQNDRETDN